MEQNESISSTAAIAQRVRELRKRRGLTAEQLADRLAEQGINWQRGTVAKLETGKRENVSVTEWLALAIVLGVAPVHLLVPPDSDGPYQVTPAREANAFDVRAWVRGFAILEGADPRTFWSEVPAIEFGARDDHPRRAAWVWQVVGYLTRSMGRLYRREDDTGVFEVDLPKAGETTMPKSGRKARREREAQRAPEGGNDAGS